MIERVCVCVILARAAMPRMQRKAQRVSSLRKGPCSSATQLKMFTESLEDTNRFSCEWHSKFCALRPHFATMWACVARCARQPPGNTKRDKLDSGQIAGLRADGSPKMNAELLAMELEAFDGGAETRIIEFLPGATLAHGFTRLPLKVFVFLWGLFLVYGPSKGQMRLALSSIRWVTTNLGMECAMVQSADCLDA